MTGSVPAGSVDGMDGMNAGSVPAGSEEGVDGMDTAVMMIETVTDMDYDGRVVSSGP